MQHSGRLQQSTPATSRLSRRFRAQVGLAVGAVLALAIVATAHAQAAWLDAPPQPWNTPGAAIPTAPAGGVIDPQCQARERTPSRPEETQVRGAGWRLADGWTTPSGAGLAIVLGNSGYDGMCRPVGYNAFVFANGQYAGTLSPVPMDSRTDGALFGMPAIRSDGKIGATFVRYAPTDPLCCPSRPNTNVVYRLEGAPGSRVVVPEQIGAGITAPAQLPRTGSAPVPAAAWLGAAFLLAGLLLRRAARPSS